MSRTIDIKKTGGFNPNLIIEDWYMWLKLAESGNHLDCLPNTLAYYRKHGNNLSSNSLLMLEGKLQIIELFSENNLYAKAKKKVFNIALIEANTFNSSLFKAAVFQCPSFLFSPYYWKKAIKLLKRKIKFIFLNLI